MRINLEDDLARTFGAAAQAAPGPDPEFPAAVAGRRRRRARTRAAGAAVLTALVASTAGFVAFRPVEPPPVDASASMPVVDMSVAKPFREVWPDALVSLPYPLPDGRDYQIEGALGGDELLAVPSDDKGFHLPVVINGRTGAVRELATPAVGYDFAGVSLTEHYITWVLERSGAGGPVRDIWAAPRGGGPAERIGRFETGDGVAVAEEGGAFYAGVRERQIVSRTPPSNPPEPDAAIFRLRPGHEPEPVPGGGRHMLTFGTWAVPVRDAYTRFQELWSDPAEAGDRAPVTYWNVATGERRTPLTLGGVTMSDCTPLVCLGTAGGSLVSYGTDGTLPLRLVGVAADPQDDALFDTTGRFVQIRLATNGPGLLWDRRTNTVGRQDENLAAMTADVIDLGDSGGRKTVLDLTRIS